MHIFQKEKNYLVLAIHWFGIHKQLFTYNVSVSEEWYSIFPSRLGKYPPLFTSTTNPLQDKAKNNKQK